MPEDVLSEGVSLEETIEESLKADRRKFLKKAGKIGLTTSATALMFTLNEKPALARSLA